MAQIEKLTRIFATTVPAFLPREKPISRKAKPACMNMTRMPATSTQTELSPTSIGSLPLFARSSVLPSASAAPGTASSASSPAPKPAAQRVLRIRPPLSNSIVEEDRGGAISRHCPRVEDSIGAVVPTVERGFSHLYNQYGDVVAGGAPARLQGAREARLRGLRGGLAPHRGEQLDHFLGGQRVLRRARLGEAVGVQQQGVAGLEIDEGVGDLRVGDDAEQRPRASERPPPAGRVDHHG